MSKLSFSSRLKSNISKLFSNPNNIEKPEERRRRFVLQISLFLLILIALSSPIIVFPLITGDPDASLLDNLVIFSTAVVCAIVWFTARAHKVNLAAWLLLVAILTVDTWLFLAVYRDIICVMAYLLIAIIALIILGTKTAYATLAYGSATIIYAGITGNFVATDRLNHLSIKFTLDTTILMVLIMATIVWLTTYLADNLSHANTLIKQQSQQIAKSLANIEQKRTLGEDVSHKVFSLTAELTSTASQQSIGSNQQATALTQVTSFVQEMTGTAQSIATKATDLSQMALQIKESTSQVKANSSEVREAGEKGVLTVERTISSNQEVSNLSANLKQILTDMELQQEQIKEVVNLIKGISNATHMLSLNAAIEAAGAGEYGERFGVVAREVKSLAERSRVASSKASEILGQVENRIELAVGVAKESYQGTQNALEAAQESGNVINTLVKSIQRNTKKVDLIEQTAGTMYTHVADITQATTQQYSSSGQALETLQNIGVVASQNANGSVEITKSAQVLEKLSQNLLETLAG